MGIKWQSSSSGTTTLSTVNFQTASSTNTALTAAYFQTGSSATTQIYPDAPTSYTMTFSTRGTSYIGSWSDSSSATIYVGDYLAVSGTSTKTLTCKAGGSSGSTRWSRSISQHASSINYTYGYPTLYGGTNSNGVALGTGITYDGSYTNIYAYATRNSTCSSHCSVDTVCGAVMVCPSKYVCPTDGIQCPTRGIQCPTRDICITDCASNIIVCGVRALSTGDDPLDGDWEETIR